MKLIHGKWKECTPCYDSRLNEYKDMPYVHLMRNIDFQGMNTVYFNKALGTSFSREDMMLIYNCLGNGVNRELTVKFIESGYDMNLLKGEEK